MNLLFVPILMFVVTGTPEMGHAQQLKNESVATGESVAPETAPISKNSYTPPKPFSPGPMTIGFKPEARVEGFRDFKDFVNSLQKDEPSRFRERISMTASAKTVNAWFQILKTKNMDLAILASNKQKAGRVVGFERKEEFMIGTPSAQTPIGFNRANESKPGPVVAHDAIGFKPIQKAARFQTKQELNRVVKELDLGSLDEILEFKARLAQTDFEELEYNAEVLRKKNPRFFQVVSRESKVQAEKLGFILQTEWTVGFKRELRVSTPMVAGEIGFKASLDCSEVMEGLI